MFDSVFDERCERVHQGRLLVGYNILEIVADSFDKSADDEIDTIFEFFAVGKVRVVALHNIFAEQQLDAAGKVAVIVVGKQHTENVIIGADICKNILQKRHRIVQNVYEVVFVHNASEFENNAVVELFKHVDSVIVVQIKSRAGYVGFGANLLDSQLVDRASANEF